MLWTRFAAVVRTGATWPYTCLLAFSGGVSDTGLGDVDWVVAGGGSAGVVFGGTGGGGMAARSAPEDSGAVPVTGCGVCVVFGADGLESPKGVTLCGSTAGARSRDGVALVVTGGVVLELGRSGGGANGDGWTKTHDGPLRHPRLGALAL